MSGNSGSRTSFGFANAIHRTENGSESLKVFFSSRRKENIPHFPEDLRLVPEEMCNAAKILGETLLLLKSKRQICNLEI